MPVIKGDCNLLELLFDAGSKEMSEEDGSDKYHILFGNSLRYLCFHAHFERISANDYQHAM